MKNKILLALGAAAVAVSAVPATAHNWHHARHHGRMCMKWRHGRCISYGHAYGRHMRDMGEMRVAPYRVGYRFGPSYAYTPYDQIPAPYVSQYHLTPDGRYVYRDDRVYVVNPNTYVVERILDAISR